MAPLTWFDRFGGFSDSTCIATAVTAMFRLFDNELVRQTERELIAQSAVIASITALEIEGRIAQGYPLGKEKPEMTDARYNPTLARLDLTKDRLLPPRRMAGRRSKPPALRLSKWENGFPV